MSAKLQRLFLLLVLLFAVLLFSTASVSSWQKIALCSFLLPSFIASIWAPRIAGVLLGIALCIMPIFGGEALNLWICVFLIGALIHDATHNITFLREKTEKHTAEYAASIGLSFLFLLVFASAIPTFFLEFDAPLLRSIFAVGGLSALDLIFAQAPFIRTMELLRSVFGFLLPLILFWQICRWEHVYSILSRVVLGLVLGALAASLYFVFQYLDLHPYFSVTRSTFWLYTGRYSASFSDPNAFGLMAGLMLPILFFAVSGRVKKYALIAAILLAVAVLWSGSRTFWLFAFWWLLVISWPMLFRSSLLVGSSCLVITVFFVLGVAYPPFNLFLQESISVPSISRLLVTLNWDSLAMILSSRLVFWQIALYLWSLAPFFGLGLQTFYHTQSYGAEAIGIELGPWRDNANSFYFQTLAEGGLVSFVLLILSFYILMRALRAPVVVKATAKGVVDDSKISFAHLTQGKHVAQWSLLALCFLFFLGSHLDFSEVRYLVVILLVMGVVKSTIPSELFLRVIRRIFISSVVLVPLSYLYVFMQGVPVARGMYVAESGGERWTTQNAYFSFCEPAKSEQYELIIAAPRPDLPLRVLVSTWDENQFVKFAEIQLQGTVPEKLMLPSSETLPLQVWVHTERLWQPAATLARGDTRLLGVQLHFKDEICERIAATR